MINSLGKGQKFNDELNLDLNNVDFDELGNVRNFNPNTTNTSK